MASEIPTSMLDGLLLAMRAVQLYKFIRALVICGLQASSNVFTLKTALYRYDIPRTQTDAQALLTFPSNCCGLVRR